MKVGANEACPCGSGRKYKKCCNGPNATNVPYSRHDREQALLALARYGEERFLADESEAFAELTGAFDDRVRELPSSFATMLMDTFSMWFGLDFVLEEGGTVVAHLLREPDAPLTRGARSYLEALARTSMRLYEVTDLVPGVSLTITDSVEGGSVQVAERTASRTMSRHDAFAARVIPRGCSGRPELERGIVSVPLMYRDQLLEEIREIRADELDAVHEGDVVSFYKDRAPELVEVMLGSIFQPMVPIVRDFEGEVVLPTRVSFFVDDERQTRWLLDQGGAHGIAPAAEGEWEWSTQGRSGGERRLAGISIADGVLTAELMSAKRAEELQGLLVRIGAGALRHRGTVHEDLQRTVAEALTKRALREEGEEEDEPAPVRGEVRISPEEQEALVAQFQGGHYRQWLDDNIPALDGQTPRIAAKSGALRSRLEALLHGLEHQYETDLKQGRPAYDPSWMWAELGLVSADDDEVPPLLAHERVGEHVPGVVELVQAAADRLRNAAWFKEGETTLDEEAMQRDLELQRFSRTARPAGNDTLHEGAFAAPYLRLMVNHELYRRKTFRVSSALSFQLEHTDLDITGGELRLPFRSFALVLADRHALSLAERVLAKQADDPLRGQLLQVVTVYITELARDAGRAIEVVFALDALGADLPSLLRYEIPVDEEASVSRFLASVAPPTRLGPDVPDASPVRGLLRLVLNAILFATGRGPTTEVRARPRKASDKALPLRERRTSDAVFHLPGTIDITSLRTLREIARGPQGRSLLTRFLVRGHWRRPARGFRDQRLRWIEPYWKGPPMSAIVERAYRLT